MGKVVESSGNFYRQYKNISKEDANRLLKSQYKEELIKHYRKFKLDTHKLSLSSHQQSIEDDLEQLQFDYMYSYSDALDLAISRNSEIFNSIIESYSK